MKKKQSNFIAKKQTIQNHRSKQKKAETKSNKILKTKAKKKRKKRIL